MEKTSLHPEDGEWNGSASEEASWQRGDGFFLHQFVGAIDLQIRPPSALVRDLDGKAGDDWCC